MTTQLNEDVTLEGAPAATKLFSVHELIGFDTDLSEVWGGGLAMVSQLLVGLANASTVKTMKPGTKGNARLNKALSPNVLRVLRAAFVLLLEDFNERGVAKPGSEAIVNKQHAALQKMIAKIDLKLEAP